MVLKISEPNEKQKQFLLATQRNICFGGARGGGKSWAVQTKAKLLCVTYPGISVLIIRRTFPELEENHTKILRKELKGFAKYVGTNKRFTFRNGSTITLKYCANDKDLENFQGTQWDIIFFDEATNLTEEQLKQIVVTCRGTNGFPKRIYYTCNPGGPGHAYIKRLFVDRKFKKGENPEDYIFIQSFVWDNDALMKSNPEYLEFLENLPPKKKAAWLEGKWDVFEGQFFEEFTDDPEHYKDRKFTHVIEPFEIPRWWNIYRSFDWGYRKPFSCDWWAVDDEGRAYLIYQYYGCTKEPNEGLRKDPYEVFKTIAEIEKSHKWLRGKRIDGVADPAIWDAEMGESIADIAEKFGVYFYKADNSRMNGWMQVHYRLRFDENGYPMMYFFSTCEAAIRTMPLMMYSETKIEDLDTTLEDHFPDSCRYFCMSRPLEAEELIPEKPRPTSDPLDLVKEQNRRHYANY